MQPYTPHGDSNTRAARRMERGPVMQPYTPHGDSNYIVSRQGPAAFGCNLIPLTGTVTLMGRTDGAAAEMQPYTPHGDSN